MQLVPRRYLTLLAIAFLTLWLWISIDHERLQTKYIIWTSSSSSSPTPGSSPTGSTLYSPSKNDVFDFPPLNNEAIRTMCDSVAWNKSLVFTCDNNHGGIGHVRNSILNCVRYAIGAGGALVLPRIALRDELEVGGLGEGEHAHPDKRGEGVEKRHGPGRKGMDFLFDQGHFVESLRMSCPDLQLIRQMEETDSQRRRGLLPESLFTNVTAGGIQNPEEWPKRLGAWIEKYMAPTPVNEPIIIDLEQSFLQYPTHSDGHGVAHSFGQILKFRKDTRVLATKVLREMMGWYEMDWTLTDPIINPSFLGAHLMTEDPMMGKREFGSEVEERHASDILYAHYQSQASAYLEAASYLKTPLLYVASGNTPEIHKLALQGSNYNVAVTHKEDLLKGKDADELESLKWDQRALVDFLVLTKGEMFTGVGHSVFSWNVALRREDEMRGVATTAGGKKWEGKLEDETWRDGLSSLFGVRGSYVESSECMWS